MKVFQKLNDNSLNINFTERPVEEQSDFSLSQNEFGDVLIKIKDKSVDLTNIEGGVARWDSTKVFSIKELAVYDGDIFRSLTDNNTGNVPTTATDYWKKLEHILEYTELPTEIDVESPCFIETKNKLYYKSRTTKGFEYKEVSNGSSPTPVGEVTSANVTINYDESLSGAGAQQQANIEFVTAIESGFCGWVNTAEYDEGDYVVWEHQLYRAKLSGRGKRPGTEVDYWEKIAQSVALMTSEEFDGVKRPSLNTLYFIRDYAKYTDPIRYNIDQKGTDEGYVVVPEGVMNTKSHRLAAWGMVPEMLDGELKPYLNEDASGLISSAFNEQGTRVCKYNEDYIDTDTYVIKIYDEHAGWLEILSKDSAIYKSFVFTAESESLIEGTNILAPSLTAADITTLASKVNSNVDVSIAYSHMSESQRLPIIQAYYSSGYCSITVLYWLPSNKYPYLLTYSKDTAGTPHVTYVDFFTDVITLPSSGTSGMLELDDINRLKNNENIKLKYFNNVDATYYYLSKDNEVTLTNKMWRYKNDKFICEIDSVTRDYTIHIIEVPSALSIECDTPVNNLLVPNLNLDEFTAVMQAFRAGIDPIITWAEGQIKVLQVSYGEGTQDFIQMMFHSLEYNQDFYITYTRSGKTVSYKIIPTRYVDVILEEDFGWIEDEDLNNIVYFREHSRIVYKTQSPVEGEMEDDFYYMYPARMWKDGYFYQGGDKFCSIDAVQGVYTIRTGGYVEGPVSEE